VLFRKQRARKFLKWFALKSNLTGAVCGDIHGGREWMNMENLFTIACTTSFGVTVQKRG
jgi:hypothetical protein